LDVGRERVMVFRDRRFLYPLLATPFGAGGAFIAVTEVERAIAGGGLKITVNGQPDFWPNPWGALFIVAFCLPFVSVGLLGWLYWLNNKIVVDDQGISSYNLFGAQDFISAWPMLNEPHEVRINNMGVIRVTVDDNELNIATNHPHCGRIINEIRLRTRPRNAVSSTQERVFPKPDRPNRVYRYGFPFQTILAVSPFFVMTLVGINWGFLEPGGSFSALFLGVTLGIPLAFIIGTAVSAANARVSVTADRLTIVNGAGRNDLDCRWEDVVGVYFESDVRSSGRGINPLGNYSVYRIDTADDSGRVRSSLSGFDAFMSELRARLPGDVLFFDQ
jgi:hypothetical protein